MARTVAKNASKSGQKSKAFGPPAPFTTLPSTLQPLTDSLNTRHVYIIHLDRFPAAFKRQIFTVPVLLNVVIAVLLAWRIYFILPTYLAIFASVIGQPSSATIDKSTHTTAQLVWVVLKRTAMFAVDFLLLKFIGPWPVSFFLEAPGNPCLWRWRVGFRHTEIVMRVSRNWGTEELMEGVKTGEESAFFKMRILPAIERQYMRAKTGYLMMDKNWDLDFATMVDATRLVDEGKVELREFEKSVLAWSEKDGWLIWQVWKLDEDGKEEESRKKIVALKDALTKMGKESLFFRWVEIVQYESSQGEFTPQRQRKTLEEVKRAFQDQGVDFDELVDSIGGLEGTPGMEPATVK